MIIDFADHESRHWVDRFEMEQVPAFGELVDMQGIHQVIQVVHHKERPHPHPAATVYVKRVGDMPRTFQTAGWDTDIEKAKTGKVVFLTVEIDGTRHTVKGGWDSHWSGRCWVYKEPKVPVGTVPLAWMGTPAPYEGDRA